MLKVAGAILLKLLSTTSGGGVRTAGLVVDGWELTGGWWVSRGGGSIGRILDLKRSSNSSGAIIVDLAQVLFFLLAGLPLLSDFLEL